MAPKDCGVGTTLVKLGTTTATAMRNFGVAGTAAERSVRSEGDFGAEALHAQFSPQQHSSQEQARRYRS